jgi:hypothetical protein
MIAPGQQPPDKRKQSWCMAAVELPESQLIPVLEDGVEQLFVCPAAIRMRSHSSH